MNETRPLAVVLSRFPVVTQTFILRELSELERRGVGVILVPLLRGRDPVVHPEAEPWIERALHAPLLDFRILLENLRVLVQRPGRYLSVLFGMAWDLRSRPKEFLALLAIFPKSIWLGRRLRELGVGHVHAHFATHAAAAAYVLSRVHRVPGPDLPFSVTVHGSDLFMNPTGLGRKLGAAAFVRTISEYNARFLLEHLSPGLDSERLRVIHCGVELERFSRRPTPGRPGTDRPARLLSVAALAPHKGLRFLIEAVVRLRAEALDVRLEVIGEGDLRSELEGQIRRAGLEDSVRLVGNRPEPEVASTLATADLFCLASIVAPDGRREGIPVSLMEAMAAGVAVVATRITGIPELVIDGETGRLVEPGDSEGLARAIRASLEQEERSAALAEAARRKVRDEFSLAGCVRRLAEEIEAASPPPANGRTR